MKFFIDQDIMNNMQFENKNHIEELLHVLEESKFNIFRPFKFHKSIILYKKTILALVNLLYEISVSNVNIYASMLELRKNDLIIKGEIEKIIKIIRGEEF